jgi:hypothetical protein
LESTMGQSADSAGNFLLPFSFFEFAIFPFIDDSTRCNQRSCMSKKIAGSPMTIRTKRCNQLIAALRQLGHLIFHNLMTVPQ